MMINGVNLNSETLHTNLLLSASKMTETKTTLPQNNKFTTFTSISSENKEGNMTLNDLKKGMQTAHIRLQNNGWNYENFCRLYKSTATNNNNNNNNQQNYNNRNLHKKETEVKVSAQILEKTHSNIPINQNEVLPKRTQDQEHAFRQIEDVHNYAKLKQTYSESGGSGESSRSSPREDEDDDEEDEEAAEDSTETVDLEQKHKNPRTDITLMSHLKYIKKYRLFKRQQEEDMHIDVETVPHEEEFHNKINMNNLKKDNEITTLEAETTPDHHARRPMNAFLIFCKRHRAIVKDRYKTLENR